LSLEDWSREPGRAVSREAALPLIEATPGFERIDAGQIDRRPVGYLRNDLTGRVLMDEQSNHAPQKIAGLVAESNRRDALMLGCEAFCGSIRAAWE